MPNTSYNSSNPLMLFPLASYPDKEYSREIIKSFSRGKIHRKAV
jgi:hypothetical protein